MSVAHHPGRCPLCGEPNACALAGDGPDEPCWCARVAISRSALERLPGEARGVVCLCRRCGVEQA